MTGILASENIPADAVRRIEEHARRSGNSVRWIHLPADPEARLDQASIDAIEVAFYSSDLYEKRPRSFFSAVRKAPKLRWLQTFNAGVDHPIFNEMLERGIRLTTSAGSTAIPIAQTAITALLMLSRGFLAWQEGQRAHRWSHVRGNRQQQADLAEQTLCVLGLGSIGAEIARLAQALGMNVIGVRRSPRTERETITEIVRPEALADVLPRCQWLAIACPLTPETRRLIDARMLARLPRGAYVMNVARGEIVDEAALIDALRQGHLAGAYLDVFETEPLPPESPLWDMPNVICTPHNSGASSGNDARIVDIFVHNFGQWCEGKPLKNEVERAGS